MNSLTRPRWSLPRHLLQLPLLGLFLLTLFAPEAQAAITATRTSSPVFYTNSDAGTATTSPQCNYLAFDVTSSDAIADAWVTLDVSGSLYMGGGDDGLYHFGPMAAGETKPVFFYVCSTHNGKTLSATQNYSLTTYSGKPSAGGVVEDVNGFSTVIDDDVIQANPNTVNAIWADINPSVLGATTTLTVDGDTGSMGCASPSTCSGSEGGPLAFNPATFTDWRADSYELVAGFLYRQWQPDQAHQPEQRRLCNRRRPVADSARAERDIAGEIGQPRHATGAGWGGDVYAERHQSGFLQCESGQLHRYAAGGRELCAGFEHVQ